MCQFTIDFDFLIFLILIDRTVVTVLSLYFILGINRTDNRFQIALPGHITVNKPPNIAVDIRSYYHNLVLQPTQSEYRVIREEFVWGWWWHLLVV